MYRCGNVNDLILIYKKYIICERTIVTKKPIIKIISWLSRFFSKVQYFP